MAVGLEQSSCLMIKDGRSQRVVNDSGSIQCGIILLATGHSVGYIEMLHDKGIGWEESIHGFRNEHPQSHRQITIWRYAVIPSWSGRLQACISFETEDQLYILHVPRRIVTAGASKDCVVTLV